MIDPNTQLVGLAVEAGRVRDGKLSRSIKRANGIVHTPAELARWALSRVDGLLRSELACTDGVGSSRVAILDPAVGPGIWLAAALDLLVPSSGSRPTVLGFDTDASAIDTARELFETKTRHARVDLALGHGNTLEIADPWGERLRDRVRVIVGNPPWAARSKSRGLTLSDDWLAEFRSDASGVSLGERRTGVLSDDYVRFFRWALEQARTSEHGAVVCLATNSSYLDGPIHRGMRAALLHAFDHIDVLDLGGNALCGGDGEPDENVFGVRVGGALTLALRRPRAHTHTARVSYTRLRGSRANKLATLADDRVLAGAAFVPSAPFYCFVPAALPQSRTRPSFSLDEAFRFHREGVQTNRDALVTDRDRVRLFERMCALSVAEAQVPGAPHLGLPRARVALERAVQAGPDGCLRPLAYRPLDARYVFALAPFCHRPRPDLARAVAHSSLCLLSARKDRGGGPWNLFGVAQGLADGCYLSTRSSCRTRVFPSHDPEGAPNLEPRLSATLSERAGLEITGQGLIHYTLGVLASESFRRERDRALHLDYPRLPLPADAGEFARTVSAGVSWARAWLDPLPLEAFAEGEPTEVVAPTYDPRRCALSAADGWMLDVTPRAWDFRVGDLAVLPTLLRSGRPLTRAFVRESVMRAERCAEAAQLAEDAYQATRPSR